MTEQAGRDVAVVDVSVQIREIADRYLKQAGAGSNRYGEHLTPVQAAQLAQINVERGLDPLLNEIMIYEGQPYLTVRGIQRIANRDPHYEGMEEPVQATAAQREAFHCHPDEHMWIVRVWRNDRRFPFTGYGRAGGPAERNYIAQTGAAPEDIRKGKGRYVDDIAIKRARRRALMDAFSMPLPYSEAAERQEVELEHYTHGPTNGPVIEGEISVPGTPSAEVPQVDEEVGAYREIDRGTGEIMDVPTITAAQGKAIHAQLKTIGFSEDDYRELLIAGFGVESSKDLSEGQAAALLESLAAIGANRNSDGQQSAASEAIARIIARNTPPEEPPEDAGPAPEPPEEDAPPKTRAQLQEEYTLLFQELATITAVEAFEVPSNAKAEALADMIERMQLERARLLGVQSAIPF